MLKDFYISKAIEKLENPSKRSRFIYYTKKLIVGSPELRHLKQYFKVPNDSRIYIPTLHFYNVLDILIRNREKEKQNRPISAFEIAKDFTDVLYDFEIPFLFYKGECRLCEGESGIKEKELLKFSSGNLNFLEKNKEYISLENLDSIEKHKEEKININFLLLGLIY